jgi:malonate transporter and related proteins
MVSRIMLTSLLVIWPVFAVIGAGFACGRMRLLGPTASSELNRFVVYLALPALLFDVLAEAHWSTLWQPGFVASFAIGSLAVFGSTLAYRVSRGHHLTDASIDALNAGYANVGYIGFPLCDVVFGRQSFALVTIAAVLTVTVLFAVAIIFVEIGMQSDVTLSRDVTLSSSKRGTHRVTIAVGKGLIRNPLLVAPLLGAVWSTLGAPLPESVKQLLHLLGGAASPCALVSLGLFLAAPRKRSTSSSPMAVTLASLKLIAQPAITALCAYGLFRIPAAPAAAAVLLAALPTGTGPFMIAEFYQRDAGVTSRTILFSTVASIATLTACLVLLRHAST